MVNLVINPTAGSGRAREIAEKIEAVLKERQVPYTAHYTEREGHATELARQLAGQGAQSVLAVGGDGTVIETATGLVGTQTALGIIPAGTGNDFIKTVGIPMNPMEALDFFLSHPARPVDAATINDTWYFNSCGTGFDVMTLDYAAKAKKHCHGIWPYLYGVICTIAHFHPVKMRVRLDDDRVLEGPMMICEAANGGFIGGGIPIAPDARPDDGLFDVVILKGVPRWKLPFYLPGLLAGRVTKFKVTTCCRAKTVEILSPDTPLRYNIDGEIIPVSSAVFRIHKDAMLLHW